MGELILKKVFKNGIYLDPLTRLPNFFKFIECDAPGLFQKKGSIIILDLANFIGFNREYGRDAGDLCLISLSDSIQKVLMSCEEASVFRTDGDEFTIVLPNVTKSEAENFVSLIQKAFENDMSKQGLSHIDMHILVIDYLNEIASITEYYQKLFTYSINDRINSADKFSEGQWQSHIIGSFTRRIKDTLAFFNEAYNLALTDDISELPNHRSARLYLDDLVSEVESRKLEFSILFIDGDNLKRYNNISYQAGNKMIKDLSLIISNSIRNDDKIFRWLSGDEFLVILNKVNHKDAFKLAERIRSEVEKQTSSWIYPITVSIGVSCYPGDDNDIEDLIIKAENANSLAKSQGKNVVVRWDNTVREKLDKILAYEAM